MEILAAAGMGLGGLVALIGWIWLLVVGFKEGGILWGLVIFFFSGLGGLIFCIVHKKGWGAWIMIVLGGLLASFAMVPMVFSNLERMQ